jgi:hypothetical protein
MNEILLTLSPEECACIAGILETTLKNTRVEEHRTRTLSYREHIVQEEKLIAGVLRRLEAARGAAACRPELAQR